MRGQSACWLVRGVGLLMMKKHVSTLLLNPVVDGDVTSYLLSEARCCGSSFEVVYGRWRGIRRIDAQCTPGSSDLRG